MDSTDTSVLERRVQELERVLGKENTCAEVALPIPELRKADRSLTSAVPTELVQAAVMLRSCRAGALAGGSGIDRAEKVVDEAIEGLKEMKTLATLAGVDVTPIIQVKDQVNTLSHEARSVAAVVQRAECDVDVVLAKYNAAVARANATVLRFADAIKRLEASSAGSA